MLRLLLISTLAVAIVVASSLYKTELESVDKECSKDFWNTFNYTWDNCVVVKEENWRECIGISANVAENAYKRCLDNNLIYRIKRLFTL